jgi:hypothetical protein
MPREVWSHNTTVSKATNFTPFQLLFRAEAILPKEIKHRRLRTVVEASPCPSEAEEKDLLESDRLKAVANLKKYQDKTRSWRDLKVKIREFDVGDLVLLQSPHIESSEKLESIWDRPYVVAEKQDQGPTISLIPKERCWSIRGMQITFIIFMFKYFVRMEVS